MRKKTRRHVIEEGLLTTAGLRVLYSSAGMALVLPASQAAAQDQIVYRGIQIRHDLGRGPALTAAQLKAGVEVVAGYIDEGSHRHEIVVTADEIAQLNAGQMVQKRSPQAAGHTHGITIDPRNTIPGDEIIDDVTPDDQDDQTDDDTDLDDRDDQQTDDRDDDRDEGRADDQTDDDRFTSKTGLTVLLGAGMAPKLYLASATPLKETKIKYALGDRKGVKTKAWWLDPMDMDGRFIYESAQGLPLDEHEYLYIKAQTRTGRTLDLVLRITQD